MLGEGEVDDGVLSKKFKSAVVVAGQDIVIVGTGTIDNIVWQSNSIGVATSAPGGQDGGR